MVLPLRLSDFLRRGGGDAPVNNSCPFWNDLWSAPACPALSISWYSHPAVLWHHQQYCHEQYCWVTSSTEINMLCNKLFAWKQTIYQCLTISLCPNFIFYYWYLFNFIENGLNVKDKRNFGEKKTKIISHKALKQDIRCTCTERDETKAFKDG